MLKISFNGTFSGCADAILGLDIRKIAEQRKKRSEVT
jgi:hypothetical protein